MDKKLKKLFLKINPLKPNSSTAGIIMQAMRNNTAFEMSGKSNGVAYLLSEKSIANAPTVINNNEQPIRIGCSYFDLYTVLITNYLHT